MYIVAEYLFVENFIINYIILESTKIITRTKVSRRRIIVTSILSALYPFVIFFDGTIFLTNFYMKIILSMIIVKLAYNSKNFYLFIKQLSTFYLMSFILGGATLGFYYFVNNSVNTIFKENHLNTGFPIKYLILGIVFGVIVINNILNYYNEKNLKEEFILDIIIYLNDKNIKLKALIDTGNSLTEPLSKLPVFVVEYNKIKDLLPEDINKIFKGGKEGDFIFLENAIRNFNNGIKFRLIPFKSVGNSNGVLIGFLPNFIIISNKDEEKRYDDLIIGIFNGKLSKDDQYNGLLNGEILSRGNLSVNEN